MRFSILTLFKLARPQTIVDCCNCQSRRFYALLSKQRSQIVSKVFIFDLKFGFSVQINLSLCVQCLKNWRFFENYRFLFSSRMAHFFGVFAPSDVRWRQRVWDFCVKRKFMVLKWGQVWDPNTCTALTKYVCHRRSAPNPPGDPKVIVISDMCIFFLQW